MFIFVICAIVIYFLLGTADYHTNFHRHFYSHTSNDSEVLQTLHVGTHVIVVVQYSIFPKYISVLLSTELSC